ncbi:MAG: ATP-binding cassette domain-containing protein [Oscillospiraceae bacterium]|jgi:ATPase subunit of ABC transporter with duplicated ATPase domains|nr:ATP-binding cassette domain-containing protein [Oscillospiraceae bacterium]
MLQINNLTVTMKKDLRTIFSDFSFTMSDTDKAVIIGEEGNGKSTLLKLIYDPALAEPYCEYSGEIITRGARLGYLAQEMSEDEKSQSAEGYFSAVSGFYDITPKELSRFCRELGLPAQTPYSEQIIETLSGGERVKLQLLRLMIEDPDLLLLDEPSNDIDIGALEFLERFINTCGKPVLFVSHDETLIENTANVIIHIEQVRRKTLARATIARAPYREYAQTRLRSLGKQERDASKEKEEFDKKAERFRKIAQKVEHRQNIVSRQDPHGGQLLKKKMHAVKAQEKRLDKERDSLTQPPDTESAIFLKFPENTRVPNGKTVLNFRLDELSAQGLPLARDIELTVTGAEKLCIIGRNGAGKTTLLRMIARQLLARGDIRAGYMPQNYFELLPMDALPPDFLAPSGLKDDLTRAKTLLGSVKYTPQEMEHKISALSGGQKAKLMFLKMILDGCNVLILDEPTRNFSPQSNPVIREILREYGGAIICVSHDRRFISEVCGKIYELTAQGLRPADISGQTDAGAADK